MLVWMSVNVPNQNIKVKFILMIDMATRYRVTEPLDIHKHGEVKDSEHGGCDQDLCHAMVDGQTKTSSDHPR